MRARDTVRVHLRRALTTDICSSNRSISAHTHTHTHTHTLSPSPLSPHWFSNFLLQSYLRRHVNDQMVRSPDLAVLLTVRPWWPGRIDQKEWLHRSLCGLPPEHDTALSDAGTQMHCPTKHDTALSDAGLKQQIGEILLAPVLRDGLIRQQLCRVYTSSDYFLPTRQIYPGPRSVSLASG